MSSASGGETNWNHAGYMLGKLTDVIDKLATGGGDVRSRLRESTPYLLALVPGMLPETEDIRFRVERALAGLTRYHDPVEYAKRPPNWPGSKFDATLNRIRNSTGSRIASDLFGAWQDLGALVDEHLSIVLASDDAPTGELVLVDDASQIPDDLPKGSIVLIDDFLG